MLIKCKDLDISYENKNIISNLSFEVNEGDYLCIVGENGSGKSSLVKAILSLSNNFKGEISFGDSLKQNEIGYLPQQNNLQNDFPASVWEVVLSGNLNNKKFSPFYSKEDKKIATENMEKLNILDLKKSSFNRLSGGQKQRVLLARALCATKKLILLDEPVTGLDPKVTNDFYETIHKLNKEGITVIMVSHDINSSLKYASKILHLGSKSTFFGSVSDYKNSKECKNFLGGE